MGFAGNLNTTTRNLKLKGGQTALVAITKLGRTAVDGYAVGDGVIVKSEEGGAIVGQSVNVLLENTDKLTKGINYGASRVVSLMQAIDAKLGKDADGRPLSDAEVSDAGFAFWQQCVAESNRDKSSPLGYIVRISATEKPGKNPGEVYTNYRYENVSTNTLEDRAQAVAMLKSMGK